MDRQTDGRGASQMPDKKDQDDLTLSVEGTIIDVSEYEKARMCICRKILESQSSMMQVQPFFRKFEINC